MDQISSSKQQRNIVQLCTNPNVAKHDQASAAAAQGDQARAGGSGQVSEERLENLENVRLLMFASQVRLRPGELLRRSTQQHQTTARQKRPEVRLRPVQLHCHTEEQPDETQANPARGNPTTNLPQRENVRL